ncbi:MAG: rhomboid family intramembrane serine protease [Hyphomicrobiaceae bacterium]|nr:rhomboid family intramembrane serine protease [Hyphomicrobiaceae bacterium]
MNTTTGREKIFNAPGIVVAVILVVSLIHSLRAVGGPFVDQFLVNYLSLYPYRIGPNANDISGGVFIGLTSLATHALLHADWMHLLTNNAWLMVFGSLIARRTSTLGFSFLFIICTVFGGLAYISVNGFVKAVVVGMSGAVSGLMGASFRIIFVAFQQGGLKTLQRYPQAIPRLPLISVMQHRKTMLATCFWILMNFFLALVDPNLLGNSGIAWEAHLGGFLAGFLLFGIVDLGRR